ncbi:Phage tail tube protein, GTA-gp10 [Roseovarius lutimaris]|uniref:Phage tail tube protein, GTA-gp10 n=1 Tax=Roseovarius lutimaris TaxID=1005928 RepID=A0A1I5CPS4_9RHOB|nr:Phage tail tube protein, GTA-gp10 [Roseovarius lutimaris]
MANPWAGEVALVIDGERQVLKLTLGALAELEAGLEAGSLIDLVDRFETVACPRRVVQVNC